VPAIDEYAVKIENLGGKVVLPKTAVPGIGYFAVHRDYKNTSDIVRIKGSPLCAFEWVVVAIVSHRSDYR